MRWILRCTVLECDWIFSIPPPAIFKTLVVIVFEIIELRSVTGDLKRAQVCSRSNVTSCDCALKIAL